MAVKYLIAHDIGTTGDKATLFTTDGEMVKSTVASYETRYYNNNWAEQNSGDWWNAVCLSTKELTAGVDTSRIAAIAFSGQMMGCLCVDRQGIPLSPSIIWADMRAVKEEAFIKEKAGERAVYNITGHRASASYTLAKLLWVKNNLPDVYKNAYKTLQTKDYIVFKMTGQFLTDYVDASGTNAFDLGKFGWSDAILDAVGIDREMFPDAVPSTHVAGTIIKEAAEACGLPEGIPVVLGSGDGGCAQVGAGAVREGVTYACFGSSAWIMAATKNMLLDDGMILFNWAHPVQGLVAPCGTMQSAGASFAWMKNQMCQYEKMLCAEKNANVYDFIDSEIASSEVTSKGLFFLPYLVGERAPRWNPDAKGAFIGLKMEHTHSDMLRSVVEGIGLNLKIILDQMKKTIEVNEMPIIGGLVKSGVCSQIFSDILGVRLSALNHLEEGTSIGAAVIAGVAVGELKSFDEVERYIREERVYIPNAENHRRYLEELKLFNRSYDALVDVFGKLSSL
jgi:xylulokinase